MVKPLLLVSLFLSTIMLTVQLGVKTKKTPDAWHAFHHIMQEDVNCTRRSKNRHRVFNRQLMLSFMLCRRRTWISQDEARTDIVFLRQNSGGGLPLSLIILCTTYYMKYSSILTIQWNVPHQHWPWMEHTSATLAVQWNKFVNVDDVNEWKRQHWPCNETYLIK